MVTDLRAVALVCASLLCPVSFTAQALEVPAKVAACQRISAPGPAIEACTAIISAPEAKAAGIAWAYNNRGLAHAQRGDYLAALSDYATAIARNAEFAPAFSNRGNAHAALGDMLRALEDHNRAIEIDPNYVSAWHNRGVDHEELGNPHAALNDYRKVLDIDPNHRGSRIGLATAACRLGRAKSSAEARLDAIRRGHIDPATFQRLLKQAGHYRGEIDGKFGKGSRAALRAWTRAGCLPVR